jgi:hypothetical protein
VRQNVAMEGPYAFCIRINQRTAEALPKAQSPGAAGHDPALASRRKSAGRLVISDAERLCLALFTSGFEWKLRGRPAGYFFTRR